VTVFSFEDEMSEIPNGLLKLMALAGPEGSRPFSSLRRGKPIAIDREAISKSSLAPLVQSALFLYFDCFDEAHNIAQDNEGTTGNWLHAIAHRREPDAGNSKYWYARVKVPPRVSQGIAQEALKVLAVVSSRGGPPWPPIESTSKDGQARGLAPTKDQKELEAFQKKLVKSGEWEPVVFVDLCDKASKEDSGTPAYQALVKIQEIEWLGLFNYLLMTNEV
jgi:hypothetical protein